MMFALADWVGRGADCSPDADFIIGQHGAIDGQCCAGKLADSTNWCLRCCVALRGVGGTGR